jgi:hypothetical protein
MISASLAVCLLQKKICEKPLCYKVRNYLSNIIEIYGYVGYSIF